MVTINIIAMILAALTLNWMLIRTRCYDSVGWWAFRILACYSLVCFVYIAYDTSQIGDTLPTRYLFIRLGWAALVGAMALSWRLLSSKNSKVSQRDFKTRLKDIFNLGDNHG